uniref:Uncharacterized protein n=1 Tax=Thermogemmatispora argillosa TaxID=2045280 RepID=A0A455SXV7_9CHLR|nr:hypothetical protein KTA_06050 [Thermogemmatispora argillosa]
MTRGRRSSSGHLRNPFAANRAAAGTEIVRGISRHLGRLSGALPDPTGGKQQRLMLALLIVVMLLLLVLISLSCYLCYLILR